MKEVERVLRWLWKLVAKLLRWFLQEAWEKPKAVRGWKWASAMWVFVLSSLALLHFLPPRALLYVLLQVGAWWVMDHEWHKPRRLGRDLPYRRR